MMLQRDRLNGVFLILRIIYPPLTLYVTHVDAALRVVLAVAILSLIVNLFYKSFYETIFKPPILFWLCWCVFSLFNSTVQGVTQHENHGLLFQLFLMPFYTLAVIAYIKIDDKILLRTILLCLTAYMMLVLAFDDFRVFGYGLRFGVKTNSNSIAILGNISTAIAFIAYFRRYISIKWLIPLFIFFSYAVILSGSKTSFGICVLAWFFLFWNKRKTLQAQKQLLIVVTGIAACLIFYFLAVKDSLVLERFITALSDSAEGNRTFGDRGSFYAEGFELFKEHPLMGIGLGNFNAESSMSYSLHTEYMVQLAECGIIGASLFLMFYGSILLGLVRIRRRGDNAQKIICDCYLFGFASILMINTTLWTYDSVIVFILLGLCVRYIIGETPSRDTGMEEQRQTTGTAQ